MKYLLFVLMPTFAFAAAELCPEVDNLSSLKAVAAFNNKCKNGDVDVKPVCLTSTPQGYVTLWTVNNVSGAPCDDNSNFSHNLSHNNLKETWPVGITTVCGAYWSGSGNLTLNVTGNNGQAKIDEFPVCSTAQSAQGTSLCGLAPLPVTLVSFSAKYNSGSHCVNVAFKTATEKGSSVVDVERSSDGKTFALVKGGSVASTHPNGGDYAVEDCEKKLKGTYYYRLHQRDSDGKEEFFKVEAVNVSETNFKTSLYPNPTPDELNVEFDTSGFESVKYRIYDLSGKLVSQDTVKLQKEDKGFKVPVQKQKAGTYIFKLTDENNREITTSKFIKQ